MKEKEDEGAGDGGSKMVEYADGIEDKKFEESKEEEEEGESDRTSKPEEDTKPVNDGDNGGNLPEESIKGAHGTEVQQKEDKMQVRVSTRTLTRKN